MTASMPAGTSPINNSSRGQVVTARWARASVLSSPIVSAFAMEKRRSSNEMGSGTISAQ